MGDKTLRSKSQGGLSYELGEGKRRNRCNVILGSAMGNEVTLFSNQILSSYLKISLQNLSDGMISGTVVMRTSELP